MTKKLESVRKIKALAEKEEVTSLGKIQGLLNEELDKLELLMKHRDGYSSEFTQSRNSVCDTHNLMTQQAFMSSLDLAISQQREIIRVRENELEKQRHSWKIASQELKAIDNYIDKKTQEEYYFSLKKEQKELDELVSLRRTPSV